MTDEPDEALPAKILVVDDSPGNRQALRAILDAPGYELVEAGSGFEALRKLLDGDYALVLLDVVMPEMNGFETAAAIRERDRAAALPILFLTAHANEAELIFQGYRVGAVDYLVKPLQPEMVRAKVAVFVELYRRRLQVERQAARLVRAEEQAVALRIADLRLAGERRYRTLADNVPHIVWSARDLAEVDYFNRRWFEYTGLSNEAVRAGWSAVVHPEDQHRCQETLAQASRLSEPCECELRLRASDGEYRWHLARAVPERGPSGEVISWLGTFTDIEEQKRNQQALSEFKGSLDAVLDAVMIFEADTWRCLYVNSGALLLLGQSEADLLAMRPFDYLPEYDEGRFRELFAAATDEQNRPVVVDTRFRRKDGRQIPVALALHPIGREPGRVVAIARDITDRKRAELEREMLYREALDAIRARDEFLSVASHELRTPLSSLQLLVEMLLRPPRRGPRVELTSDVVTAKLEVAARQVDRLSRLVAELMDVSRITAGRLQLDLEESDLVPQVRDVVNRFTEDAARAHSTVTVEANAPAALTSGRWDRLRIDQVITNLLSNALKFGAGKPVELTVGGDASGTLLTIRDHGIGIPAEDIERVFERFERAITARSYGGLGLGLYIVRQIVEAHGGTIRVESQPGAGSTFTVSLPRQPALEARANEADPDR
jgi:PAS domain S-box-containing protein